MAVSQCERQDNEKAVGQKSVGQLKQKKKHMKNFEVEWNVFIVKNKSTDH